MDSDARAAVSTLKGVEKTLVWGFVAVRSVDLAQALLAVVEGALHSSTNVAADVVFLCAAAVESAGVGVWLIRRRAVRAAPGAIWVDLGFAVVALGGLSLYSHPGDRIASWVAWVFPFTLSTAGLVGLYFRRLAAALACSLVLAISYLSVVVLPLAGQAGTGAATGVVNASAYPAFAGVLWLFARFVRRLAGEADDARRRVAELERDRSRAVVHDMLGYLRLDRLLEASPEARLLMVQQALTKYRHMRAYVDGTDQPGDLEGCLRSVVELYPSLRVRFVSNLETPTRLDDEVARRLHQAVDTSLANVQQNASEASVTVSAEISDGTVFVRVVDDGPGFDLDAAPPGFGIAETLGRQLASVGGHGQVSSRPGRGTEVSIRVPRSSR